jgi:hypothetical protein
MGAEGDQRWWVVATLLASLNATLAEVSTIWKLRKFDATNYDIYCSFANIASWWRVRIFGDVGNSCAVTAGGKGFGQ